MDDKDKQATPPAAEKFSISAEEFAALKAKAEKADLMSAQVDQLSVSLATLQRQRRHDQLKERCEKFMAIPVDAGVLAEKFQALEEKDPELAKYFDGLLETLDKALSQADLFGQVGSGRRGAQGETLNDVAQQVLKEQFGGDPAKWSEALSAAGKQRPELLRAYLHGAPVSDDEGQEG